MALINGGKPICRRDFMGHVIDYLKWIDDKKPVYCDEFGAIIFDKKGKPMRLEGSIL
jgi:hypothetical protein